MPVTTECQVQFDLETRFFTSLFQLPATTQSHTTAAKAFLPFNVCIVKDSYTIKLLAGQYLDRMFVTSIPTFITYWNPTLPQEMVFGVGPLESNQEMKLEVLWMGLVF